jgi:hypothetical protein
MMIYVGVPPYDFSAERIAEADISTDPILLSALGVDSTRYRALLERGFVEQNYFSDQPGIIRVIVTFGIMACVLTFYNTEIHELPTGEPIVSI